MRAIINWTGLLPCLMGQSAQRATCGTTVCVIWAKIRSIQDLDNSGGPPTPRLLWLTPLRLSQTHPQALAPSCLLAGLLNLPTDDKLVQQAVDFMEAKNEVQLADIAKVMV